MDDFGEAVVVFRGLDEQLIEGSGRAPDRDRRVRLEKTGNRIGAKSCALVSQLLAAEFARHIA